MKKKRLPLAMLENLAAALFLILLSVVSLVAALIILAGISMTLLLMEGIL